MLIRNAELEGSASLDVRIASGRIVEIGRGIAPQPGEPRLEAAGGALLPGLHDHHIHLHALAAARSSVRCGPPVVRDASGLAAVLASAPSGGDGWVRGVGYHETVAGPLDRDLLDGWLADRPLRVQHRSGALWALNSAGIARLGLGGDAPPEGMERDSTGRPTGRLFRLDSWLRARIGPAVPPDLADVGSLLSRFGVTGVTDATPGNDAGTLALLAEAQRRGALPQSVLVMGGPVLPEAAGPGLARGALKILLDERALPGFDELGGWIRDAHAEDRPAAIHCVTRSELVLAAGALAAAGSHEGDRIEHASVTPPEVMALVAELPLSVVTQPGFVAERGDQYLAEVDPVDRPWLYRCQGFLDAGVPLGAGTDAPFGDPDPWRAMRAAVDRRSESGVQLGSGEALSPERALALFTTSAEAPGGVPRRVAVGATADLVLLERPWARARDQLESSAVVATLRAGRWLAGSVAPTRD